ncbi:hypothetical protein [Kiloniella sp.]|uniref:hypothetical protein n=1 Tax=Kiloniella sp. TaxID=1938587 RepID=UPI003B02BD33
MARSRNSRIIDNFKNAVTNDALTGLRRNIDNVEKELERLLKASHGRLFKAMVAKSIGVDRTPNMGAFTPPWITKYSKSYETRKSKMPVGLKKFYVKTGKLKTSLETLNPKTVLGNPVASHSKGGTVGVKGVRLVQTKRGPAARGSDGRFAKRGDIERALPDTITITPFRELPSTIQLSDVLDQMRLSPGDEKKITVGNSSRPFIVNYLNWWAEREVRNALRKIVK